MVVVGGWSTGAPTNLIETYDPRGDIWQMLEQPDQEKPIFTYTNRCDNFAPRAYHGCVYMDNHIFVIGGFGNFKKSFSYV